MPRQRPTAKRSIVWTFFDVSGDKKEAVCKICKKVSVNHGNTSNLREHLKRVHPIQYEDEEDRLRPQNKAGNSEPSGNGHITPPTLSDQRPAVG